MSLQQLLFAVANFMFAFNFGHGSGIVRSVCLPMFKTNSRPSRERGVRTASNQTGETGKAQFTVLNRPW